MSLTNAGARLASTSTLLNSRWRQLRNHWRDTQAREFEAAYIEELLTELKRSQSTINQISELMDRAKADCE